MRATALNPALFTTCPRCGAFVSASIGSSDLECPARRGTTAPKPGGAA